jgi:hypothetical protein
MQGLLERNLQEAHELNLKLRNSEYANGLTGKMARTPGSMENGS